MAATTHVAEVTSPIPPAKFFKAFAVDDIAPKVLPQVITSVETLEGDGGPGTIKLTTFTEGFVKHRVDGLDKDNLIFSYTIVEGVALTEKVESVSFEVKFSASADGGSVCKITSTYQPKGEAQLTTEEVSAGSGKVAGILQAVSGYLCANPDA